MKSNLTLFASGIRGLSLNLLNPLFQYRNFFTRYFLFWIIRNDWKLSNKFFCGSDHSAAQFDKNI
ncbi:MAG: hypothetical protein COT22_00745 [Ignavibacteria bacterium CG08_land_8_20_14_0_20_37_9]|nr:MAG: hypothetical protein COT22_00745 [Ignavibacteria bacterium CG08_land_8_20_14_0_20_37_9]PJC60101.1 MAG: hypothetical protein CO025_04150 [Ignavibacteria bacterium CG_4_9_14_0_2_um_filter_37_13]